MGPVGIDLGTTFSAIAHIDGSGRPAVIPNNRGKPITPSVVCFRHGETIIGEEAKELQAIGHPTAAFFKRQMGQANWVFAADGREYSATDLSALVLGKLKRDAERATGGAIADAVITVPAYFRNPEREATIEAGRKAGLNVSQVVNEPTAAAIAYGIRTDARGQIVLVYDLGGGTFDVTLLRVDADEIRVLTSDGDHELGGKDWDDRILAFLGRRFTDEFGVDPMAESETLSDMLVRAEDAKRRLSSAQSTRIPIVHGGYRGSYELDRRTFEQHTADLMERTISLTRKVLDDQNIEPSQVDGVLLVGGSTRMPMVHDFVARHFNRAPLAGVNVDEAVAVGAAVMAEQRAAPGNPALPVPRHSLAIGPRRRAVDVTNHSLGMIAIDATRTSYLNSVILPKNREIPCVQSRPYQHRTRRRGPLEIFITQGESASPADVSYLGRHVVHDVPAEPRGLTLIDIEYRYDASGTVQVGARVKSSGEALRVSVDPLPADIPARFLRPPDQQAPQHVSAYLMFDLSGSMSGNPLDEAKKAAQSFLCHTDLTHCSLGIIGFSDSVTTKLEASQNSRAIEKAIDALAVGETGFGNAGDPFEELLRLLRGTGPRFGIVLADGVWSDQPRAIERAKACRDEEIEIIAVGFGSADRSFLDAIASSQDVSFFTDLAGLVETFGSIAQVLTETGGLLAPASGTASKTGLLGFVRRA